MATNTLVQSIEARPVVAIVGGAVAGSEAAARLADRGAVAVVFEQGARPYGKIEDGLPRWHEKLRTQEYRRIDENLARPNVIFVPNTQIGSDIAWEELVDRFSAVVLANGAWRDRALPVDGADRFDGLGLVYQNPFVYWFNHYEENGYEGPSFDIEDRTVVIGGGLASIDVVKIINLELYRRALRERGIDVSIEALELKGIPKALEEHGLDITSLGIEGCTLYYRRGKRDMPLASGDTSDPKTLQKLETAREKIMDRVMRKYLVRFEPYARPIEIMESSGRLGGVRFQRTKIEEGRVRDVKGETFEVQTPLVISSIGSVPLGIDGVPMKGELYDFADWDTGELRDMPGVFGLGNVLTGKGNIRDSRQNAVEVSERFVSRYLGLEARGDQTESVQIPDVSLTVNAAAGATPATPSEQKAIGAWIAERHSRLGYANLEAWLTSRRP